MDSFDRLTPSERRAFITLGAIIAGIVLFLAGLLTGQAIALVS